MIRNKTKEKFDNIVYGLSFIFALIATIALISAAYADNPFDGLEYGLESSISYKIFVLFCISMILFLVSVMLLCIFFCIFLVMLYPLIAIIFLIINWKNSNNTLLASSPPQAVTDKPDNNNDNMFAWFLAFLMFLGVFWPSDDNKDDG